jgi:hypothetical protein
MLERFRSALVKSYVGAIAIGWLVAQGLTDAVNIFASPLMMWFTQKLFPQPSSLFSSPRNPGFPYWLALPPFVRASLLLLIAFLMLRWLYWEPSQRHANMQTGEPQEGT